MTPEELLAQAGQEIDRAERLLKVAQVARMANLSERTVWYDIQRGRLRVERMRIGKRNRTRVRVSVARAYVFLVEQTAQTGAIE